jgi:uncharacterized membrane protein
MAMALALARAVTLLGLLSSGVTWWIYTLGVGAGKCDSPETGCQAVISSSYGSLLGIPLPLLGILGFSVALGLLVHPIGRRAFLLGPFCAIVAMAGLTLLGVQVIALQKYCTVCIAVNLSAITLGVVVLFGKLSRPVTGMRPSRVSGWKWVCLALGALVLSFPAYWIVVMTSACAGKPGK